ncbi:uncharacterized protein LOC124373773 [Homalodisca vitripennis]|uniref:uncharacterized protein LOC124373773 n=1 Tax=Homalodisca vitripennis TaxID=197043 RepID=UPI001EEA74F7|nr:uncharacterized protein LOC124373773 [Homalodisca vitripennis]
MFSLICSSKKMASQNNRKRPNPKSIISSYFQKVEKITDDNEPRVKKTNTSSSQPDPDSCINTLSISLTDAASNNTTIMNTEEHNENQNTSLELGRDGSCANDIGLFVNKKTDEFTKCQLLERHWTPPKSYEFPHSIHTKNGKEVKRYLGHQHLEQRNWLVFSDVKKGLFCKFCVLFSDKKCGHNKGMLAQNLVTQPLTSYAKLLGKDGFIQTHENTAYHKICVQATLLNSLCTAEFLISMMSLIDVLKVSLPLSRLLQTPSLDTNRASTAVTNTMATLKERRIKCDDIFKQIFFETKALAEELDVELKLPRRTGSQTKRSNHPGDVEEYYRRSIYIPLLDNVF